MNILQQEPRPNQTRVDLVDTAWTSFVAINENLGKQLKSEHFDTRSRKPNWNTTISAEARRHEARRTAMGAYEQGGYRPSPAVSCLPSNTRLAVGEHPPPSTPSHHQTMDDVNHSWAAWYVKLKDAYTLQTADIRRQRVKLAVHRKQTKDGKAIEDWQGTLSVQGTAYNSAFKKGCKGASAAAGAYGPDANDPDGPPIWHTDPETVKAMQQAFFAGLVKSHSMDQSTRRPRGGTQGNAAFGTTGPP